MHRPSRLNLALVLIALLSIAGGGKLTHTFAAHHASVEGSASSCLHLPGQQEAPLPAHPDDPDESEHDCVLCVSLGTGLKCIQPESSLPVATDASQRACAHSAETALPSRFLAGNRSPRAPPRA